MSPVISKGSGAADRSVSRVIDKENKWTGPEWLRYLRAVFRFVVLKAVVDLVVSFVLVLGFYAIALALTRLLPSESRGLTLRIQSGTIIVGLFYLLAIIITASLRFYRLVKQDLGQPSVAIPPGQTQNPIAPDEGNA